MRTFSDGTQPHEENGYWKGAGYVLLPLEWVSHGYNQTLTYTINVSPGNPIGYLLLLRGKRVDDIDALPDVEYVAYAAEGQPSSFNVDYLAVEEAQFSDYIATYAAGAPIWGGFVHKRSTGVALSPTKSSHLDVMVREISFPTSHHETIAVWSAYQPLAFGRYLELYHLLELLFDWQIVQEIKSLGDDLYGIGQILSRHSSKELDCLRYVMSSRCADHEAIAASLARVTTVEAFSRKVLFQYHPDTSPIKEQEFGDLFVSCSFGSTNPTIRKRARDVNFDYRALVIKIASHWVYRIRCCIAHARIGEYVMQPIDEKAVVDFFEPLLRDIVVQAMKR